MRHSEFGFGALNGLSFDELYEAHLKAFKDYPFQWTKEALQQTIKRRGFSSEHSFGAFHKNSLVSFTWNGMGTFNGKRTAYDTGTGTAEDYRGKGLATKIFEYSVPFLKHAGVKQYLLEVLTENQKAQSVYTKQGFSTTRIFHCFRTTSNDVKIPIRPFPKDVEIRKTKLDIDMMSSMHDFVLSWQNNFESMLRNPSAVEIYGAFKGEELSGYGIIEPASGDIPQLAVKKSERGKGIGTKILNTLIRQNRARIVKVINIPSDCVETIGFILKAGIPEIATQYEMIRTI